MANLVLSTNLQQAFHQKVRSDDYKITFPESCSHVAALSTIEQLCSGKLSDIQPEVTPETSSNLKFADLLPASLAREILLSRIREDKVIGTLLQQEIQSIPPIQPGQ